MIQTRTWPYGTTRLAKVVECIKQRHHLKAQVLTDELGEGHVLLAGAQDESAKTGDRGTLTFTKGGPTGGYWKFKKD
jgi:hypothetical protein